jgi:hypothetical protein
MREFTAEMFCICGLVITNGDVCSLFGYLICRVCMLLITVTVEIQTVIPIILLPLIFFVLLPPYWLNQYDLSGGLQVTFRPKPLVIMPMTLLLVTRSSFIYFHLDLKSVCEPGLACCFYVQVPHVVLTSKSYGNICFPGKFCTRYKPLQEQF